MKPLLDCPQCVAPFQSILRRREVVLLRHTERYLRLESRSIPPGNECRNHGLVSAGRDAEKINDWHLVLERLTKPSIIRVFGIGPLESIVDRLIAFENLSVDIALVSRKFRRRMLVFANRSAAQGRCVQDREFELEAA